MKAGWLMTAVCLAASVAPAAAQVYQWKDAQGRVIYSDQPPPPSVRDVQQKAMKGNVIEGGEAYATRLAREKSPVTLFTTNCGALCDQARKLLSDRGIPFASKDPQADPAAQAELQKLTGHSKVPVLVVGSEKVDGFEDGLWQAALDRAGYPKSVPARQPAAPAAAPAPKP